MPSGCSPASVAELLEIRLGVDAGGEGRERGKQRGERLRHFHPDRSLVDLRHGLYRREQEAPGALLIDRSCQREDDVIGRQRGSVGEHHALAQLEVGGQAVVGDRPFRGQLGIDALAVGTQANQPLVEGQLGEDRSVVLGIVGIEGEDVGRARDDDRASLGRLLRLPGADDRCRGRDATDQSIE